MQPESELHGGCFLREEESNLKPAELQAAFSL
jgi:hypothetical protein